MDPSCEKKIQAFERNKTWEITKLPSEKKVTDCKWVYKIKDKANGEIERSRARLVAKSYNQNKGLD